MGEPRQDQLRCCRQLLEAVRPLTRWRGHGGWRHEAGNDREQSLTSPVGPDGESGAVRTTGRPRHVRVAFLLLGASLLAFIGGLVVLIAVAGLDDWDSLAVLIVGLVATAVVLVGMFVFAGTLFVALMTALFGWRSAVLFAVGFAVVAVVGVVIISLGGAS